VRSNLTRLNRVFLQTNDIGATLQQFIGDPPPSNVTASPVGDNDTELLFRRRRSWRNSDEETAAIRNDDWIRLMENVLWKTRRRRKGEPTFRKRRSSSSSSDGKGSITRKKRDDSARKRHSRQADSDVEYEDYSDEDYIDAELLNSPVNEFIRSYMRAVSKYWPMFEKKDLEMRHVFQSVLTRTTIASNMNRTTLTNAGVPFKEFVVTCRYFASACSTFCIEETSTKLTKGTVDPERSAARATVVTAGHCTHAKLSSGQALASCYSCCVHSRGLS